LNDHCLEIELLMFFPLYIKEVLWFIWVTGKVLSGSGILIELMSLIISHHYVLESWMQCSISNSLNGFTLRSWFMSLAISLNNNGKNWKQQDMSPKIYMKRKKIIRGQSWRWLFLTNRTVKSLLNLTPIAISSIPLSHTKSHYLDKLCFYFPLKIIFWIFILSISRYRFE